MFTKESIKNFEKLCLQPGISNYEINSGISDLIFNIVNKISSKSEIDKYGNVVSIIGNGKKEIIIDAHLDEFGFFIQKYKDKIYLKPIGAFDYNSVKNQQVKIVNKNIFGNLKLTDDKNVEFLPKKNNDIKKISKEDFVTFEKSFKVKEEGIIKATSLDNRVGCFLVIELMKNLKNKLPNNLSVKFIFSAGEESGKFLLNKAIKEKKYSIIIIDAAYADPNKFVNCGNDIKIPRIDEGCAIQTRGENFTIKKDFLEKIEKLAIANNVNFQKEIPPKNQGKTNLSGLKLNNENDCAIINVPVKNQHEILSECSFTDIYSAFNMILLIIKSIAKIH